MRALRIHEFGGPEVLRIDDIPPRSPGPGQVRIRVRATALNHLDLWVRRGLPGVHLPRVLGADAAGEVMEVGPGVSTVSVGQRVLLDPGSSCRSCAACARGDASMCVRYGILGEHGDGAAADEVVVDDAQALPIPAGLDFAEAASIPLVALTAWRMLVPRGRLRAGESVLVHSAGAGVGVMCVQIARLAGARVVATAGTEKKRQSLAELGADAVIDSHHPDLARAARDANAGEPFDVVVDYIGKDTFRTSVKVARNGGRVLTCGATSGWDPVLDLRHVFFRQIEVIGSTMGSRADLEAALRCFDRGQLRPVVGAVLPFERAADAHRLLEDRAVFGKVVLTL
ncbi:zinc-binding dehydrogenase [Myxococcota bacterium]|nr:zinc-binding dehydrogenase [Myxococcota bacterium]